MPHRNDSTAEKIACDYLRPLFGFSRKRTANLEEAEELTGEILVEIYDSLSKNPEIRDLVKWIWSIAHHTYAKRRTRNKRESGTIGIPPEWIADRRTIGPEAEFARNETTAEIRRRVAYLSEIHHQIVVLRYFRNRKVREIATAMGIPEGTVKWHLSEIRNGFRTEGEERMNASKNESIGRLGCAPERLAVGMCGKGNGGVDASKIVNSRLIPQNILLATYSQAMSTQDIAKELGIPTPYLADEVKLLNDSELLWKTDDDRFITDFVIMNKMMKSEWYAIIEEHLQSYVEATKSFFDDNRNEIIGLTSQIDESGYDLALWTLIPFAFDSHRMIRPDLSDGFAELPARKDGGRWIIMASHHEADQDNFYDRYRFTNMNGVMMKWADGCDSWSLETTWTGFQTHRQNLIMSKWQEIRALIDGLVASELRVDSVDTRDAELFAELCDSGILRIDNGICSLEVLWFDREQLESLHAITAKYHEIMRDDAVSVYHRFRAIMEKRAPSNVRSQIPAVAMLPVHLICMFILNDLSRSGYLRALSEGEKKRIMILLQGEHKLTD